MKLWGRGQETELSHGLRASMHFEEETELNAINYEKGNGPLL